MKATISWAAELTQVQEVSLRGTADLTFWKDRLKQERLLPVEHHGEAQILITAADAKYCGIRFSELSFFILVSPEEQIREKGAYLVRRKGQGVPLLEGG